MELKEFRRQSLEEEQRKVVRNYECLNRIAGKGQIVLAGSSLMQFFPVNEMLQNTGCDLCVYNRGVTGYVSSQMLAQLDTLVLDLRPSKLFINIGTNDLGRGLEDELWNNYPAIIRAVQDKVHGCRIYVMAYYPCNDLDDFGLSEEDHRARFAIRTPQSLLKANEKLRDMADCLHVRYIDVNDGLADSRGVLRKEYCIDGVHLWPNGYIPVLNNLLPYFTE